MRKVDDGGIKREKKNVVYSGQSTARTTTDWNADRPCQFLLKSSLLVPLDLVCCMITGCIADSGPGHLQMFHIEMYHCTMYLIMRSRHNTILSSLPLGCVRSKF